MLFIDVETTTINEKEPGGIYQLSAIFVKDDEIIDTFSATMAPDREFAISKDVRKFMAKNDIDPEAIYKYTPQVIVFKEFIQFLDNYINVYNRIDKVHFTAYNAHFDNRFVRAWFNKNNNKYFGSYFWSNNIDVMVLWSEILRNDRKELPNFQLKTLCKLLNIEINAHDAESDIMATYELYLAYQERVTLKL